MDRTSWKQQGFFVFHFVCEFWVILMISLWKRYAWRLRSCILLRFDLITFRFALYENQCIMYSVLSKNSDSHPCTSRPLEDTSGRESRYLLCPDVMFFWSVSRHANSMKTSRKHQKIRERQFLYDFLDVGLRKRVLLGAQYSRQALFGSSVVLQC